MPGPTVLVPLDGSTLAEASLYYVAALKGLGPFEATLVHVTEPHEHRRHAERDWDAAAYLDRAAARLREMTGLTVRTQIPEGPPHTGILAQADDPGVAMIVTTTHGLSGFERWRIGSVADKVVRGAPCPVLVAGPESQGAPPAFTRMLVPLDGSSLAEEALPYAKLLAQRLDAAVRLVRAVIPRTIPDEIAGSLTADVIESYELMAAEYLEEARLELEIHQPVDTMVMTGPAAEVILGQVDEGACDLVVMTSHGRHGFTRFAMGSVTDTVVAAGQAPVLVVKPGQWDRFQALLSAGRTAA